MTGVLITHTDEEMNYNSVTVRDIPVFKAHCGAEDKSNLKLANHMEIRIHSPGGRVLITAREDGEM